MNSGRGLVREDPGSDSAGWLGPEKPSGSVPEPLEIQHECQTSDSDQAAGIAALIVPASCPE
jgi:hypothetical protein